MAFDIKSSAFAQNASIPVQYTCDGEDLSPPLSWTDPPEGTKSLALICDDPDAPMGTWVHWVLWGIGADVRSLPEGLGKRVQLPAGAAEGISDFRRPGYGGPCPPPGKPHRYFFKLYALDVELKASAKSEKADIVEAMKDHILGQTQLMGTYKR